MVNKGGLVNEFRDYHRVDLYPNYLQLIQTGAISSIKGYKPSKTKLKLECKFIYHDKTDFMRWSFRSNGVRDPSLKYAKYGRVYCEEGSISISNELGRWSNLFDYTLTEDQIKPRGGTVHISPPPLHKELSLIMIDDGDEINVEYKIHDGDVYKIQSDSYTQSGYYRVMAFNRHLEGNVADITKLELSVIEQDKKNNQSKKPLITTLQ